MNEIGMIVIGGVIRCTLLALVGLVLGMLLRRRGPAAGSLVSLTTLLLLLALPAVGLSPWPRWWTYDATMAARPAEPTPSPSTSPVTARPDVSDSSAVQPADQSRNPANQESWFLTFAREFERELRQPSVAHDTARWRWPAWVALGLLASLGVGLIRLVVGLRAVAVLRRSCRPIEDEAMLDALAVCRAEMCCTIPVAILESAEVSTPATIGWRRPIILLPATWTDWNEQERRVVLAHELAHISRGDYASGVLAQLSVAVHFYHPLAHWLAARLRLQQELAADAWGARLSGGHRPYVTILARMALRQSERPVSWPARSFLPARGMFLRRLEMLRDPKKIRHAPLSRAARTLTVAALLAAGLLVAGFRGPDGPPLAFAQGAEKPKGGSGIDALAYVPTEAVLVLDGRPADLLGLPNFKPIAESINTNILNRIEPRWISAEEIARITVYWLTGPNGEQARPGPDPFGPPSGLIVQIRQAKTDLKEHIVKLFGGAEVFSYSGQTYFRSNHPERFSAFTPDDRTIVVANEILLRDLIKAGPNARPRHPWDRAWKEIEQGQFTLGVDCLWFRARVRQMIGINNPAAAATGAFTPLWEKTRALAFGVNALDGLKIDALGICESSEDAKQVGDTLRAVLTLGRNSMQTLHRQARVAPSQTHGRSESLLLLADLIDPLLEKAEVKIEEGKAQSTVRLRSVTEIKVAELARAMMPPVQAARTAARRAQSVNNMKMIGLAFHNYASANNTFPPPAGKGPNSQHPHSWRVDLLPYLEQQELYNQYHFDEPWDGPNNRKLIDKMPVVYRAPGGKESKSQPSYFVFTGPDTLFLGDRGTGFAQITDGTSNTILIVEAERDIPWTKPEDLPYDPRMPLPKLGGYFPGGFNVGMADGSVRFVSDKIDDQVLRALITKAGGEVVSLDRIPNPTQPANR